MTHTLHDSDRHAIEPIELWEQYCDRAVFEQYPIHLQSNQSVNGEALPAVYMVGQIPILKNWTRSLQTESRLHNGNCLNERLMAKTGAGQLQSMDLTNITSASIFPTFALGLVYHSQVPAHVSVAYADAYNCWLKNYCNANPARLHPVGVISRHDPNQMLMQLSRMVDDGWKCVMLRPEPILGRVIGHEDYEPFWEMCVRHDIAIAIHGSAHLDGNTAGTDRFTSRFSLLACAHPIEMMMCFLSLLENGVFERYPTLKFAFLEAGASWVPHWLWRLDHICYPDFPNQTAQHIKMLPSEYFKRHCWVAVEPGEPCLREVIQMIGHKNLIFGSDFPHPEHGHLFINDIGKEMPELSETELCDIFQNNAARFFGLNTV